jgi:hairy-and-enhancer-of-split protein
MDIQSSLSTRPFLERKRRARINKCLEELKELMVFALEQERGEGAVRLEKADILEVTVRHMRKLRAVHSLTLTPSTTYAQRFRSGFTTCATEARQFIASPASGFEPQKATAVVSYLSERLEQLASLPPSEFFQRQSSFIRFTDSTEDLGAEDCFDDDVDNGGHIPLDLSHKGN